MSKITGTDYVPQQLTEEQIWEEVETWVNSLMKEGYDLSEYTWEEMYESYVTEFWGALGKAALGALGRGARPVVGGALRQAGKLGTIAGLAGIGDELLTRGAGRELVGKALTQTRKLGPALRSEPTGSSDTAKPTPSTGKVISAAGGKGGTVTTNTKYAATLNGKKGNVIYNDSGKKSFTADSYKHNDAFDLVLEYLLSQGHTDTLEEALYVMMEMSSETIQDIIEGNGPNPSMDYDLPGAPSSPPLLPPLSTKKTAPPSVKKNSGPPPLPPITK